MISVLINGTEYIPTPEQPKPETMTSFEAWILHNQIDKSGFDYAMIDYSDYNSGRNEIKDERFHQLLEQFRNARSMLRDYVSAEIDKAQKL